VAHLRTLVLLAALTSSAARAASPTVAVMPFRDLSGQPSAVGEAIRETVTTDLKQIGGVRVIERGSLDKILAEQKLQATSSDLDPSTAARVGKLLGATLIVAGAYQQSPPKVRLTARFVQVETGEIVGTAKVDGRASELLKLQDQVTAELLKSAGLGAHAKRIAERSRPPLKSLKAVELYGQAVTEGDDEKRRVLLAAAVAEDQSFSYAVDDLAALEKRMKRYQANADVARDKAIDEARAQLKQEKDPAKANALAMNLLTQLFGARRYKRLFVEARELIAHPPPPSPYPGAAQVPEVALFYVFTAEAQLKQTDAQLRDGEEFLRKFPQSAYFASVKQQMQSVIDARRTAEEKRAALPAELAKLTSEQRWDLCRVADVYRAAMMHREAQRLLRACLEVGKSATAKKYVLQELLREDIECADWPAARRDLPALEQEDKDFYRSMKGYYDNAIPNDG
jgi:TolB-like protein